MDDRPLETAAQRRAAQPLFWPVLLIGIGLVWLLASLDLIPRAEWGVLLRLWPLLLVVIGLDMLMGRSIPALGALLALLTVAVALFIALYAGPLGLTPPDGAGEVLPLISLGELGELQSGTLREPLDGAQRARVRLETATRETSITVLDGDDARLLGGSYNDYAAPQLERRDGLEPEVVLRPAPQRPRIIFGRLLEGPRWDVALTRRIPIDLELVVGSGAVTADLTEARLDALRVTGGSGRLRLALPADEVTARLTLGSGSAVVRLPADADADLVLQGGSGRTEIEIQPGAALRAEVTGGSGGMTIDVPRGAALRVEVRAEGSGTLRLPREVQRVSGDAGMLGEWETPGYDRATQRIALVLRGGSGRIEVR